MMHFRIEYELINGSLSVGALALAVLSEMHPEAGEVLGRFVSIEEVPDSAVELHSYAEQEYINQHRHQIAEIQSWTLEEADAKAAAYNAKRRADWQRELERWDPHIKVVEGMIQQLTSWKPTAADDEIRSRLGRIKYLMLAELNTFLADRCLIPPADESGLNGEQFREREVGRLMNLIGRKKKFMEGANAQADAIHPLALALQINLDQLTAETQS